MTLAEDPPNTPVSLARRTTDFTLGWNKSVFLSFTDFQAFYRLAVKGGFCCNSKIATSSKPHGQAKSSPARRGGPKNFIKLDGNTATPIHLHIVCRLFLHHRSRVG